MHKYQALPLFMAALLGLAAGCSASAPSTGPGAPNAGPAAGPKVNRLVMGVIPPAVESNEPRHLNQPEMFALRPMYEYLIGIDENNGGFIPQLASAWKLEPDGTSFRFQLRPGVQFHGNWGEFKSTDVLYSWQTSRSRTRSNPTLRTGGWW